MRDFVLEYMRAARIPITRENYIELNWPGIDPKEPLPGELEAEIPEELQRS